MGGGHRNRSLRRPTINRRVGWLSPPSRPLSDSEATTKQHFRGRSRLPPQVALLSAMAEVFTRYRPSVSRSIALGFSNALARRLLAPIEKVASELLVEIGDSPPQSLAQYAWGRMRLNIVQVGL